MGNIYRIAGIYFPEGKSVRRTERRRHIPRIFRRYSRRLASPRAQPTCAYSRSADVARNRRDRSKHTGRREMFANPRRPRFLEQDNKENRIRDDTRGGVTSTSAGSFTRGNLRISVILPMIRTVPAAEVALITIINRLADSESYIASLNLPRRRPDASTTRTTSQVA